jgi:hypothetical protein
MIVILAMVLILPCLATILLRAAGLNRGAPVLGGILVGVLIGPTVAGRLWPTQFEHALRGDHLQQVARRQTLLRHEGELVIAQRDALTPSETSSIRERQVRELAVIDLQVQDAVWDHQQTLRLLVLIFTAVVLGSSGLLPVPKATSTQPWIHSAAVGFAAAILPAVLAFAACRFWWNLSLAESAMVAAALSIGPWRLTDADRVAADDAEVGGARMMQSAGRIASVLAIGAAFAAIVLHFGRRDAWLVLPLLFMPVGWLVLRSLTGLAITKLIHHLNEYVLVPALACSVILGVDVLESAKFWPILIVIVISDDGRWIGATAGALSLGGRGVLRTLRLVMGCVSASPTQLAVTAVGLWTGIVSPGLALALVLGCALIELTALWRRGLVDRILQVERDLE